MKRKIIGLLSIIALVFAFSCTENANPEPKVIVQKDSFTMSVNGTVWVPDSTIMIEHPTKTEYYIALAIKYKDKAKTQPSETYYFFIPIKAKAGEAVVLPSKTYNLANIEYGNDKGIAADLTNDSRSTAEYKIVNSDGKLLTMTFSANFFYGNDLQTIKNGAASFYIKKI